MGFPPLPRSYMCDRILRFLSTGGRTHVKNKNRCRDGHLACSCSEWPKSSLRGWLNRSRLLLACAVRP
jgi:hypothetical protein